MNKKKLTFTVFKLIALAIILYVGIPFVIQGYQMSQEKPSPDMPVTFIADMRPKAGAPVGTIKVRLEPANAFVIGDKITADIEVDVNWLDQNDTASVQLTFLDCLSIDQEWAWTNSSHYNMMIVPRYNYSMPTYLVYRARAFIWYTHEGIFGANVTVYSPYSLELMAFPFATLDGTVDWSFPEMIHIKSYDYIEQKANAQFTNAISLEILGLTLVAISPIAVTVVSLSERAYESIMEKPKVASTSESQVRKDIEASKTKDRKENSIARK